MSFQGDVGGIGLAELLQSLSRGRREGVLRLHARNGLTSTLGLSEGVVSFLPDDGEDPQMWRDRVRQSWIHDFDDRMIALRMSEVARAHRIERVYEILDSEGAHFRFQPGSIPSESASTTIEDPSQGRLGEVHCKGCPVELLLLEYARMSDETEGAAAELGFTNYVVPRTLDPGGAEERNIRFLQECDGLSTLVEISDRMGWPIRQTRLVFLEHLRQSEVRLAEYRELLVLAQKELSHGHVSRASARLVGWIQASPPGPLDEGDAELLAGEFKADRMGPLLNLMPTRESRAMLRRIDHRLGDQATAVRHWRELGRLKRTDPIIEIHRIIAEFDWEEDPECPSLRDILDAARRLREGNYPGRSAALLRMAASTEPSNASSRLEIGLGMLDCGLIEEGAAWILDACQTLIASGQAERAISPLRTLLETDGSIREARRMLGQLKHLTVRRQLFRKNSAIVLSIVAIIGSTAWVHLKSQEQRDTRLAQVQSMLDQPGQAQALLDTYFAKDSTPEIRDLRDTIFERLRTQESEWRTAWFESYREAQLACSLGEPEQGLRHALELSKPPTLTTIVEGWPLMTDLYNGLAARLEKDMESLGEVELDDPDQVERERLLAGVVRKVSAVMDGVEEEVDTGDLDQRLQEIDSELSWRIKDRIDRIEFRDREELLSRQDLMLAAARAHDLTGDLNKSIEVYENLIATDQSGRLAEIFEEELLDVRRRDKAYTQARSLSMEGEHFKALELLEEEFEDPHSLPLPWTLNVFPADAMVHLSDGSTRSVPFVYESRPGETVSFSIEREDHSSQPLVIDTPGDHFVWLSRNPERSWSPGGRVDALPVALGEDQIVCDRTGNIARLGADEKPIWQSKILSLGGIGRAPIFLPSRPEHLLLLTEDGEAWLLDSRDGERTGPWIMGSSPLEGPVATSEGVLAQLKDGRMMYWTNRVKPIEKPEARIEKDQHSGTTVGMAVLSREDGSRRLLESPWTAWRVELQDEVYRVTRAGDPQGGYAIRRDGDWSYLAWEAPNPSAPDGRLWISDGGGLAAFEE